MARAALPCTAMIFHSANTWVGANKPYVKTSTSQQTSDSVVSGLEFVIVLYFFVESHWINSLFHMGQATSAASFR